MANYNPNFESIGQAFVQAYYQRFDVSDGNTRSQGLSDLYDPNESIMTFEGTQLKGKQAILEKFQGLTFRSIQRGVTKIDSQPVADGSIMVSVIGQLKTDEDPVQSYTQSFLLKPTPGGGGFFIGNEIFRLNIHDM